MSKSMLSTALYRYFWQLSTLQIPTSFSGGGAHQNFFTMSTCYVTHGDVRPRFWGLRRLLRVARLLRVRAPYTRLTLRAPAHVAMATRYTALLAEIPPHTRYTHDSPYPSPPACSIDVSIFATRTGTSIYYYCAFQLQVPLILNILR